jgi:hypothetical protein
VDHSRTDALALAVLADFPFEERHLFAIFPVDPFGELSPNVKMLVKYHPEFAQSGEIAQKHMVRLADAEAVPENVDY